MIVIAIIATMSIAGVAGWYGFMPSYRLRTAVDDLQATMQMARLKAVKENAMTTVRFTGTNTYTVFIDADEDGTLDSGEEVFLTRTLPPGISLFAATDAGFAQYNSRGFPESGAMSFRLRNGKGQFLGIRMEASGAFSIQTSSTGAAGTWADQYD
jgi:Tfp pilus assembly protein FimT